MPPLFTAVAVDGRSHLDDRTCEELRPPVTNPTALTSDDFDMAIKKLRDTWMTEFNAGQAEKVADLYAPEAVLMRRNGSVHNRCLIPRPKATI